MTAALSLICSFFSFRLWSTFTISSLPLFPVFVFEKTKHNHKKQVYATFLQVYFGFFFFSEDAFSWLVNFSLTGAPSSTAPPPCLLIWSTIQTWLNMTCHQLKEVRKRLIFCFYTQQLHTHCSSNKRFDHLNDSMHPVLRIFLQTDCSSCSCVNFTDYMFFCLFLCCRHHGWFPLSSRTYEECNFSNGHQGNNSEWILRT